jgi:hypothetical protein
MYRQGDVLVVPIGKLPQGLEQVPPEGNRVVLAHGEATGHAHAIKKQEASLFRDPKLMAVFLQVGQEGALLEHDEHSTIKLPSGNYQVIRQREYSPQAIRNVAD